MKRCRMLLFAVWGLMASLQAQARADEEGFVPMFNGQDLSGWERCLPSEKRAKPSPEWNHYRVECRDGVLKLAVNGKVVSGGSECKPRKGYLCLESEGSECHFRNLRIKELPSSNPSADEVAP